MILVSVYDKKASIYWPPMAFEGVAQAIRAYATAFMKERSSTFVQFPEDFDLYEVGQYEQSDGQVVSTWPPQYIESIANIKASLQLAGAQKGQVQE